MCLYCRHHICKRRDKWSSIGMPRMPCSTSCRGQRGDTGGSCDGGGHMEGVGGLVVELTDGMDTEYADAI